jgi:hypothetical protein
VSIHPEFFWFAGSHGRQFLGKEMIGEDFSLWQYVHALLHFNVDVTIGHQREKILLGDDIEGDKFDGDV